MLGEIFFLPDQTLLRLASQVKSLLRNQTMLSDIENIPSAKSTVKATAIAHAAITGSC